MTASLMHPPTLRSVLEPAAPFVDDGDLSTDELGARIVGLAGQLGAATCRWLLLVARFDARDGAAGSGLPSTARWLAHACGLAHRTAVEHVRVARALAEFGSLATEMSAGRLSYSQVRAISRVPHRGESQVVDDLIQVARHGSASQLEFVVRGLRTVDGNDSDRERPTEQYVSSAWTDESQWRCSARLDPENGAVVASAIDAVSRAENLTRAAALVRMAEIALAAINDADAAPRHLRGDERAAVIVHLDASAVDTAPTQPLGRRAEPRSAERAPVAPQRPCLPFARIADGPGLPARVIERLLCSGRIRTAVWDARGTVRDLGRSHRVVSDRLFRALLLRDNGSCTFPGCGSQAGLEAHHVRHWLYGGRTDVANLVLLCKAHHLGHHNREFTIARHSGGRFVFARADGRRIDDRVDTARLSYRVAAVEREFRDVDPVAAGSLWRGDRLDREYAVAVLAERRTPNAECADRARWAGQPGPGG